jgi:hypothetical protein
MTLGYVPPGICELIRYMDPDLGIVRAEKHSEKCWTISAIRPDHHMVRGRFNLGDSGRWTWIPLNIGALNVLKHGAW